jgi:hypothetical protein
MLVTSMLDKSALELCALFLKFSNSIGVITYPSDIRVRMRDLPNAEASCAYSD